jgi:hypothetical protein
MGRQAFIPGALFKVLPVWCHARTDNNALLSFTLFDRGSRLERFIESKGLQVLYPSWIATTMDAYR